MISNSPWQQSVWKKNFTKLHITGQKLTWNIHWENSETPWTNGETPLISLAQKLSSVGKWLELEKIGSKNCWRVADVGVGL